MLVEPFPVNGSARIAELAFQFDRDGFAPGGEQPAARKFLKLNAREAVALTVDESEGVGLRIGERASFGNGGIEEISHGRHCHGRDGR